MTGETASPSDCTRVASTPSSPFQRKHTYWAAAILMGIVLTLMGDLIFLPGDEVVSHIKGDTAQNHIFMRELGFEEIRRGNLPLWNPYLFSGTPFLGSMQAGLLYPLNAAYLFLPIAKAINLDVALHLFLLGFLTFLWMRNWRIHWVGALYAGIVVMLCGAIFLRVLAGQLNVIASLAWFPLLLLSIDGVIAHASRKYFPSPWVLLGVIATTMLLYAGYPQALFICAVSAALYSVLRLPSARNTWLAVLELGIIGGLPIFLGGIQLWTGVAIGFESIRGGEMTYEFASSFSFPPEKFITMLVPEFFGDQIRVWPWGRWAYWDDSLYIGVVSLVFVVPGLGSRHTALKRISVILILVMLGISLGRYTPLHGWLFDFVPGFDKFRAPSKFLFIVSFFLASIVGLGVDRLLEDQASSKFVGRVAVAFGGILLLAVSIFIFWNSRQDGAPWGGLLTFMKSAPNTYVWINVSPEYITQSLRLAAINVVLSASFLMTVGVLLMASRQRPGFVLCAVGVGIVELMIFAFANRDTFSIQQLEPEFLGQAHSMVGDSERLLLVTSVHVNESNYAVSERASSIWGYDPIMLSRYAQLVSGMVTGRTHQERILENVYDWGAEPVGESIRRGFFRFTPTGSTYNDRIFQLLRCRAILKFSLEERFDNFMAYIRGLENGEHQNNSDGYISDREIHIHLVNDPLPRFLFVSSYQVEKDWNKILDLLESPKFDMRSEIVLEDEPHPAPSQSAGQADIRVMDESTDHVTLKVETSQAGILLITDAYSEGWKATALPGSVQQEYDVMPADLALRAIPLEAGSHLFRMEYLPDAFIYGRIATFAGLGVFFILAVVSYKRRNKPAPESA